MTKFVNENNAIYVRRRHLSLRPPSVDSGASGSSSGRLHVLDTKTVQGPRPRKVKGDYEKEGLLFRLSDGRVQTLRSTLRTCVSPPTPSPFVGRTKWTSVPPGLTIPRLTQHLRSTRLLSQGRVSSDTPPVVRSVGPSCRTRKGTEATVVGRARCG